jgi:hypothetical protein
MRKLTFSKKPPFGDYPCVFRGFEDVDVSKWKGHDGSPRIRAVFEILSGTERGKRLEQTTSVEARPESPLARILLGLAGRDISDGEQLDVDTFIGLYYSVTWESNPKSEAGNGHISSLRPIAASGALATAATELANEKVLAEIPF